MAFVLVGIVLVACNLLGYGPMANWNWDFFGDFWKFALPFVLAAVWWVFSDSTGLTKRRAMDRDTQRKQDRRDRNIEAMGLGHLHKPRDGKPRK